MLCASKYLVAELTFIIWVQEILTSFFIVSGEAPQVPVVSPKSGMSSPATMFI